MAAGVGRALSPAVDVLVAGAGPVGLALALQAHQHGARVLVVERRSGLPRPSRAMLLWPRTLEALDRLGVSERLETGKAPSLPTRVHLGRHAVSVRLADLAVPGHSRPPMMVPQAQLEGALLEAVARCGIPLRTGTELTGFRLDDEGVAVTLRSSEGPEQVACRFLVGCDGADSAVRRLAGISWRGRTYPQEAVLADLNLGDLAPSVAHIGAGRAGIGFLFPAGEHGGDWRLVATRVAPGNGAPPGRDGSPVPVTDLQEVMRGANLPGQVSAAVWSTRVRLQRRGADRYRAGPVFLAGDAAHVFSPAGAQGVNTGLQDATNLGWKLATARRGDVHTPALLASYETERLPVARCVGALTQTLLHGEGDERAPFRLLRTRVLPVAAPLVPLALRARPLTAAAGWVLAQDWVSYAAGPVSVRHRGGPFQGLRAGSLVADQELLVDGRTVRLHILTAGPGVHLLHGPLADVPEFADVSTDRVDSWPGGLVAGVRPDGYVGYVGHQERAGEAQRLRRWLETVTGTRGAAE